MICFSFSNTKHSLNNRYQLFKDSDNTILLDKKTGVTWRNVWNNNTDRIPCNWSIMEHEHDNIKSCPIGVQIIKYNRDIEHCPYFSNLFDDIDIALEIKNLNAKDKKYFNKLKNSKKSDEIKKEMKSVGYTDEQINSLHSLTGKEYLIKSWKKERNEWKREVKKIKKENF